MQLLKTISEKEGKNVLYIPNQNFLETDFKDIIRTERYSETVKTNYILGLDSFLPETIKKNVFPNATLCIIPQGFSDPYSSQFIKPFNKNETLLFLEQVKSADINPTIIKTVVEYSAGIPKLADKLLTYYINHHNLSVSRILNDTYIQKDLDHIYQSFLSQLNTESLKLWTGLIAIGKPLLAFKKSISNEIESSSFTFLQKLGFDTFIQSPLLLSFFRKKIGIHAIQEFKKKGIKEFISASNNNSLFIWTANNELRFLETDSSIIKIASNIFKSKTLFGRIDWEKSLVNNEPIHSKDDIISVGSEVRFILGRRDKDIPRTKNYKRLNRKYKELIFRGDSASRKGLFEEAEQCYKEVENLKYDSATKFISDSTHGKIRLANLYRIQGRLEDSINICKPIVRSTPNPYAYLCMAVCEFWRGNITEALEFIELCISWKACYINAMIWKSRMVLHNKDFVSSEKILSQIEEKKLSNDNRFIFIILNYFLFKKSEFPSIIKNSNWHNKAIHFISMNRKDLPARQIPLIILFLNFIKTKEKEFGEIEKRYLSYKFSEGVLLDLYWWEKLFQTT